MTLIKLSAIQIRRGCHMTDWIKSRVGLLQVKVISLEKMELLLIRNIW